MEKLIKIQGDLKAPKNQYNKFGNYKYRSCEDILEALKPLLNENSCLLYLTDEIVEIGGRNYVKATCNFNDGKTLYTTFAFAREEETKKGMDGSQITGAASSYARKYALNAMFLIDDTKDSDSTNTHNKEPKKSESKKSVTANDTENLMAIWKLQIDNCKDLPSLEALWKENKDTIAGDQDILKLFGDRKAELNG